MLQLAAHLPEIPYIRLSKIERGEVFARADELHRIARALQVSPDALLLDVSDPRFSMEDWAADFIDIAAVDHGEEEFAVLLAAALRRRRGQDKRLTISMLESEYGLPPVIVSRLENAQKPFGRWNRQTQSAVMRLFGVETIAALRRVVLDLSDAGELDTFLPAISNPVLRLAKTRNRINELRDALQQAPSPVMQADDEEPVRSNSDTAPSSTVRRLTLFGAPMADGLIAMRQTGEWVETALRAGPRSFALRVHRSPVGAGLPVNSILIIDPDRYPAPGGLAAVREGGAYRIVSVSVDRMGALIGHSLNPEREIALDQIDPGAIAAIAGAIFA